ncbi:MAG: hypothetical protein K8R40_08250 [Anaerolineaceae bacterium]|nr:hypothetical protein [Anaerolineaceae bacterium]
MEETIFNPDEELIHQEDRPVVLQPEITEEEIQPAEEPLSDRHEVNKPILSLDEANDDFLVPDENAILEGQFEEIPAEELAAEEANPRIKPALLAVITILALIVLCFIMGLIIFFMILPDIRADRELGAAFLSLCSSLVAIKQ